MSPNEHEASLYEAVAEEVAALIEIPREKLGPDDSLLDFGLDSLRIMTLVERWNERGSEVSFLMLAEAPTLREFARLLGR